MPRPEMTQEQKDIFKKRMSDYREAHKDDPKKPRQKKVKKTDSSEHKVEKKGDHIVMNTRITLTKEHLQDLLKYFE